MVRVRSGPVIEQYTSQQKPIEFRLLDQHYSDKWNPILKKSEGCMELYGNTYEGISIRLDLPYLLSYYMLLPLNTSLDYAKTVYCKLIQEIPELRDLIYTWEYRHKIDGQRFGLLRKYPYIQLIFQSKKAFDRCKTLMNNYINPRDGRARFLTNINYLRAPNELKILMFEANITPVDCFNRKYLNPSAWLTVNNYKVIPEDIHRKTTTSQVYVSCNKIDDVIWDKVRVDVPRLVLGILDIETTTKSPKPENASPNGNGNAGANGWWSDKAKSTAPIHAQANTTNKSATANNKSKNNKRKAPANENAFANLFLQPGTKRLAVDDNGTPSNLPQPRVLTQSTLAPPGNANNANPKPLRPQVLSVSVIVSTQGGPSNVAPSFETVCFAWKPSKQIIGVRIVQCRDEADLIRRLFHLLTREEDVDVFVGHNSQGFDQLYLLQRAEDLGLQDCLYWGRTLRDRSRKTMGKTESMSHPGRLHIDTFKFYKEFHKDLKTRKLSALAQEFFDHPEDPKRREHLTKENGPKHSSPNIAIMCEKLPETLFGNSKDELPWQQIAPYFFSGDLDKVTTLLHYNIKDVVLTYRLFLKHKMLFAMLGFSLVYGVPAQYITCRGQEIRCMGRLWRVLYQKGMIFNRYMHDEDDPFLYSFPYGGAIVQKTKKGIRSCVILDFASMYPSIMQEYRICKSSCVEKRFLTKAEYAEIKRRFEILEERVEGHTIIIVQSDKETKQEIGYIPEIQAELGKERKRYKALLAKAEKDGDDTLLSIYDSLQNAVKVCMNSLYGLNGNLGKRKAAQADLDREQATKLRKQADGTAVTVPVVHAKQDKNQTSLVDLFAKINNENHAKDEVKETQPLEEKRENLTNQPSQQRGDPEDAADAENSRMSTEEDELQYQQEYEQYAQELEMLCEDENEYEELLAEAMDDPDTIIEQNDPDAKKNPEDEDYADDSDDEEQMDWGEFEQENVNSTGSKAGGGYWPYWPVASLITHFGRKIITQCKKLILERYPGSCIPAGDTDSLFIEFPLKKSDFANPETYRAELFRLGHDAATYCTDYWAKKGRGCLKFELEKIMDPCVLYDKKKYYFGVLYKEAKDKNDQIYIKCDGVKISGIETKKCDKCPELRNLMQFIIDTVAWEKKIDLTEAVKQRIIKIRDGRGISQDQFVMTKNLSKDIDDYASPVEYLAVAVRNKRTGRASSKKGEEVAYVFTKPSNINMKNATATDFAMDAQEALETETPLYYRYYLTNHFYSPITTIMDVIEPNIERLYNAWINNQSNLQTLFNNMPKSYETTSQTMTTNVATMKATANPVKPPIPVAATNKSLAQLGKRALHSISDSKLQPPSKKLATTNNKTASKGNVSKKPMINPSATTYQSSLASLFCHAIQ